MKIWCCHFEDMKCLYEEHLRPKQTILGRRPMLTVSIPLPRLTTGVKVENCLLHSFLWINALKNGASLIKWPFFQCGYILAADFILQQGCGMF